MDNNIALITALFNEKGANFYKDIYFPIISYSLISLFKEHGGDERYFQISDLQEYIRNKFYIEIPIVVLRNSVLALRDKTQADIVIETLGAKADCIYIKRIVDEQVSEAINNEAEQIEDSFSLLESLFQQYLAAEHLDSNTSLYDFISECEEECYALIVGDDSSEVEGIDASYSNTARFVDWLKINRTDLYQYFTDIVWGAVISAFLRRNQFEFSIKPNDKVIYYLDSALVLALFGLDTGYNVAYAKDVMRNVQASGGILKVHGMTVREVVRILDSVIKDQGPRFGSAIAYGFEENQMSLSDIVMLRNAIEKRLQSELGITVDVVSTQRLEDSEHKLEHHPNVLFLKEKWGSYAADNFREKHDVFMCETVSKMNDGISQPEKMKGFFVTLNRDLVELYHKADGMSCVITPGNAILKLWIHGTQISDVRGCVLTEIVSRSMALSQTDARKKIKLFCKYRKNEELSSRDVADMYNSLIHRSNDVILKFNKLEEIDRSEAEDKETAVAAIMSGVLEGIHEESKLRHQLYSEQVKMNQKLKEDISTLESVLKTISEEKTRSEIVIEKLQKENSENQLLIQQLQAGAEKQNKEKELIGELNELKDKKAPLDKDRDKAKKRLASFWVVLGIDILAFFGLIFLICLLVKKVSKRIPVTWEVTSILAIIAILLTTRSYWLTGKIKYYQCQKEQILYWEEKHPEYGELKDLISDKEKELKNVRLKGV